MGPMKRTQWFCVWNPFGFLMFSYAFLMIFLAEFLMNLFCTSENMFWFAYELLLTFLWISSDFIMSFLHSSSAVLMYFLGSSYAVLMQFLKLHTFFEKLHTFLPKRYEVFLPKRYEVFKTAEELHKNCIRNS